MFRLMHYFHIVQDRPSLKGYRERLPICYIMLNYSVYCIIYLVIDGSHLIVCLGRRGPEWPLHGDMENLEAFRHRPFLSIPGQSFQNPLQDDAAEDTKQLPSLFANTQVFRKHSDISFNSTD